MRPREAASHMVGAQLFRTLPGRCITRTNLATTEPSLCFKRAVLGSPARSVPLSWDATHDGDSSCSTLHTGCWRCA